MLDTDIVGNAARLQPVMEEGVDMLVRNHPSCRSSRAIGLFGAVDMQGPDGAAFQEFKGPAHPVTGALKKALLDEGIFGLLRAPVLHCTPPLVISEAELREGFAKVGLHVT